MNYLKIKLIMIKIIIIWAWWHAEVIKNSILYTKDYQFLWYLDDNKVWSEILGKISTYSQYITSVKFICWIGDNNLREKYYSIIKEAWGKFWNVIHPNSYIESWVILGEWIFIWSNTYINIGSRIWNNSIINNGVIVEHHNSIWMNVHMAPWVITWWNVSVWDNVFLWLWSIIINNITIWDNVFSWAWTLIHKNVDENLKIVWVPFKIL